MSERFDIVFGAPGSGKTTYAAKLAHDHLKKGIAVWSNVPIDGCFKVEKDDLGKYNISYGLLIWDECGIDFDNRNFKSNFTPAQVEFFKKHRHFHLDIVIFSQSPNDMDLKLRVLATKMFVVKKTLLSRYIIRVREISKKVDINELSHQVESQDYWRGKLLIGSKYFLAPRYWQYFDSFDMPEYENKKWQIFQRSDHD